MRKPRLTLQRQMVALVFLAILLWAWPVAPEAVRRWRLCDAKRVRYQADARAAYAAAARAAARSKPEVAAHFRREAESLDGKSRAYGRALLIPWQFWSLGDH